jgi:hypothetical protein
MDSVGEMKSMGFSGRREARKAPLILSLWLAAGLITACGGGDSDAPAPVDFQSMQEAFSRTFARGEYVFRTQAELQAAWTPAPQQFGEAMPMPVVDFAQYTVVGISLGTGIRCNVPIITRVTAYGDDIVVSYRSNEGTGVTTLACLHQWRLSDFARVPKVRGTATFERVSAAPE